MELIKLSNISKVIKGETLFQIEDQTVNQGDKIGLIGKNGAGKSTLLKILVGLDSNFVGQIQPKGNYAYVPQIKATTTESGGEQMKRMVNEALAQQAEILVLDEPSSNLDQDNMEWLTQILSYYEGTLILVSHDRDLLNQVVNQIWELEGGKLTKYIGNFDSYQQIKESEIERQEIDYKKYQRKVHQLEQEAIKRTEKAQSFKRKKKNISYSDYKVNSRIGKYDGQQKSLAKSAKALQKRIEQLDIVEKPKQDRDFTFKAVGHLNEKQGQTLLNLNPGKIKVPQRLLFTFSEFKVLAGAKLSIQGPNQAGKTTFLKQIIQQQLTGYYAESLNIGYFAQNFDNLILEKSVLENVQKDSLQSNYLIRNVLGSLGFNILKVDEPVYHLSGGERVRLSFAKVLLGDHHLLILDEPTNFLDIPTLRTVENFIKNHPAAIILVSHDQAFVENTVDKHYYIDNKQLVSSSYREIYQDNKQKEITLLEFQLEKLMGDEAVDMEEIILLQEKINALKD